MRRLTLTLVLLAVAGVGVGDAQAYRGGATSPITDPLNKELVRTLVRDIDAANAESTAVKTGVTRMQVAAAVRPGLTGLGTLALAVGAGELGWKIGSTIYEKVSIPGLPGSGPGTVATTLWYWETSNLSAVYGGSAPASPAWVLAFTLAASPTINRTQWKASGTNNVGSAGMTFLSAYPFGTPIADVGFGAGLYLTAAQMEARAVRLPSTSTEWATLPQRTTAFTSPGSTSDAELNAALDIVGARDATDRTATDLPAEEAIDFINAELVPGYDPDAFVMPNCLVLTATACQSALTGLGHTGVVTVTELNISTADLTKAAGAVITQSETAGATVGSDVAVTLTANPDPLPLELPAPLPTETYTAYTTRLAALGYLGTVTLHELSEAAGEPLLGPDAPVAVRIPALSPLAARTVRLPGGWPSSDPRVWPDTDVELWHNPATYAPVPAEDVPPAEGGGGGGDPGELDFSPITDIDFGCKFPYGIFCYAIGFTELFDVTPDAPRFEFTLGFMGSAGVPAVGEAAYNVDLNVMDDYMALWRTILSVCLWVGAVYFVATRFLGFNAGGDPGEAIEDVL